jgi:hypothetical protein
MAVVKIKNSELEAGWCLIETDDYPHEYEVYDDAPAKPAKGAKAVAATEVAAQVETPLEPAPGAGAEAPVAEQPQTGWTQPNG